MKELIKSIIKDFHKRGISKFVERNIKVPLNSGKIISIIGPRRAGKTYLMYQVMSKIGDITDIIYINFEDERLEITSKELNQILEAYFEMYPNKKSGNLFFFFDEIQEINGWEKFVRRVYDTISRNIFITGSSSKLLSKEIATSLRGRTLTYEVFPLSFEEYLKFKKIEKDIYSTKGKSKLIFIFNEYMHRGGFPEIIDADREIYEKILTNYFEVMVYRDIVERHNIKNTLPLKLFIKKLIANTAKEFSINKIFNELKSVGIKISKDTLYKFLDHCEDAYLIISINNFSESLSKQTIKKAYTIDTGLIAMISFALSKDKGRFLENIVLIELKRRNNEAYYYKDNLECDFIIRDKDKITQAIQVCLGISNPETKKREIGGLVQAMSKYKLKVGLILTMENEAVLKSKGRKIIVKPVWKWLLEK